MRQLTNGLELFFFTHVESAVLNTEQILDGRKTFKLAVTHQSASGFSILGSGFSISSDLKDVEKSPPDTVNPRLTTSNIVGSCCIRLYVAKSLTGFKLCATTCNRVSKRTQQRQRRLRKRHSKSQFAASNFITLIPSRSIRQMLAIFSGVEF